MGLVGLLTLNWVAAVARFQVNGVFWDQWIFLKPLFEGGEWFDIFTQQHGPHRQGLAFLITAWIMDLSAWDSRVEALWIVSLLTASAVLMLWWKHRLSGKLEGWDLWIPFAALAMLQYENVILVPNASHSMFPLVLMMVAALVLQRPLGRLRWLGLGLVGLLAIFTGFGLFVWGALMVVATLVVVGEIRAKRWSHLIAPGGGILVLVGALVGFLRGYVFNPASPGATFPHLPVWDYPMFMVRMVASRMGLLDGTGAALFWGGAVLLVTVLVCGQMAWRVVRDGADDPKKLTTVFFLSLGLGFAVFTALGRVHLGVAGGEASRYAPLLISLWLGLVAWAAIQKGRIWNRLAAVLGWLMVVAPWTDVWDRPWKDLPGTLGMIERSRTAIVWTTGHKMKWLLAWEETGDWREAERRVPLGVHPDPEHAPLDEQIGFLREHDLSYFSQPEVRFGWRPWWNPLGIRWVQGMGGEHEQWMAEESRFLVEGKREAFVNLRVRWKSAGMPSDAPIEIQWGDYRGMTSYAELSRGLSLPASPKTEQLVLRSPQGAMAINPPHDNRMASFLVPDPIVSEIPRHPVRWFSETEPGLLKDTVRFELTDGFYEWEAGGAFVWANSAATIETRSRRPRYLNVVIAGRFEPVGSGPVRIYLNEREWLLDWSTGELKFTLLVPGGRSNQIVVRNISGEISPQAAGESDDTRSLALRFSRISFDEQPAFEVLSEDD
ncbi:MAG: hypothetical protein SynsKO_19730 [Synoicihabitans sp.]